MRHLTILVLFFSLCSTAQDIDRVSVFFDFNSDYLNPSEKQKIDSLLTTPNIDIEKIIAHCDPIGTDNSNFELGNLRNLSVSNYLSSKGFKVANQIVIGEKDSKNVAKNDFPNFRRVDIHYSIPVNLSVTEEKVNTFPDQFKEIKLDSIGSSTKPIVLNIQFAPGQDILIGNSYNEIMNLYAFLRANEDISAFIRGHVCCSHDPMLSSARAYVVYSMLVERGISTTRLRFEGFSNTIPAVFPETNELDRQANRRVDVIFSKIR
jgi:outer membrane protein OmpA-like peptidoglycan-associated protein